MNDIQKQYLLEVKRLLPCSSSEKKRCIVELEADVSAFLENYPNATLEDLYTSIGSPESIAESFIARMNHIQFSRKLSVSRKIAIGVIAIIAFLAVVISAVAISVANDVHDIQNGNFTEFIGDSTEAEPPITSDTEIY